MDRLLFWHPRLPFRPSIILRLFPRHLSFRMNPMVSTLHSQFTMPSPPFIYPLSGRDIDLLRYILNLLSEMWRSQLTSRYVGLRSVPSTQGQVRRDEAVQKL
jgi:hypothetical protein